MRRFLFRFSAFFFFAFCFFAFVFALLRISQYRLLRLPDDKHIVFLGNSHIEGAINDTIIGGSYNFGRSGDRVEMEYLKLKLLKSVNPEIDTVFVGFDNVLMYHSTQEEFNSVQMHPYMYSAMDCEDWWKVLTMSSPSYLESFVVHPFSWMKLLDMRHLLKSKCDIRDFISLGGNDWPDEDRLLEDIEKRGNLTGRYPEQKHDSLNAYFLRKTIQFCKKNRISLFFICPPQHQYTPCNKTDYKKWYAEEFSDVEFFDCLEMQMADSCYSNLDHLNFKGARIFSEYIDKEILNH